MNYLKSVHKIDSYKIFLTINSQNINKTILSLNCLQSIEYIRFKSYLKDNDNIV